MGVTATMPAIFFIYFSLLIYPSRRQWSCSPPSPGVGREHLTIVKCEYINQSFAIFVLWQR